LSDATETRVGAAASPAIVDVAFGDSDRAYVDNSGLVLLVPFLENFFTRLDLIEEQRFLSREARQRAIGLLQYLADGVPTPLEYLMPLNKVLCGMDPSDIFEFGEPVTDREAEECSNLLAAVIEHAEVLGEISTTGLQGTFLIRCGVLSSEDGTWVLRVERETHDVLLDRLSWSFEWVALPWTSAPMRVEW
jgi:hypothetical protein